MSAPTCPFCLRLPCRCTIPDMVTVYGVPDTGGPYVPQPERVLWLLAPPPAARDCPKCGTQAGMAPTYEPPGFDVDDKGQTQDHSERLRWRCPRCGYSETTPCAGAEVKS